MKKETVPENLFPFVLRSRQLVVGRPNLMRQSKHLEFILITDDLSENSRQEILQNFACPVVQRYTSAELEVFFHVRGTKVVGFLKSALTSEISRLLKSGRISGSAAAPEPDATPEKATPGSA